MEKNTDFSNRDSGRVAGGLILVAVGAFLLMRNMGFSLPNWLFTWPMILILIGIYSGFKHDFKNNSWFILIAVGGFFLVSKFIPSLGLEPLFWPLIIIGIGILFMLRPGNRDRWNYKNAPGNDSLKNGAAVSYQEPTGNATIDSNDYLQIRSVFSGVDRNVVSKNFQGGKISCVFGGAEIDLSQADISSPVVIRLEMVFGGAKIVLPAHWALQNEIDGIFHGVDDKRGFNPDASINPVKVLILRGSVVFGGIEIRSY